MPRIQYVARDFSAKSLEVIRTADEICRTYSDQGYDLTLRQLYYQFVARGLLANQQSEYKRLGAIVNDARLAGLMDWDHVVDRTRNLRELAHWVSPDHIVSAVAEQYRTPRWENQATRVEVWVEKDALTGVIARTADRLDVPWFSCRGYTSQSELWAAAQRHIGYAQASQDSVVVHLGDHDPSGVDMSRDIRDRLTLFGADVTVERIALNMHQVRAYSPPPNPAKLTDSRSGGYIAKHGDQSWELDALSPDVLDRLITEAVLAHRDEAQWGVGHRRDGGAARHADPGQSAVGPGRHIPGGPVMTATVLHDTTSLEQDYADLLCRVGVDASVVTYTRSPDDWCQWASGCDQPASVYLDGEDPWTGRRLTSADSAPEYCYEHGLAFARRLVDDGVISPCGEVWTVTA